MVRFVTVLLALSLSSSICAAQSTLEKIWNQATKQSSSSNLSSDKITAGLREALKTSTTRAVAQTGKPDGFLKNEAIKILLPEKLRNAEKTLRMVGQGAQLDELEVAMNRAAEQATPKAKQIFINALMSMSIDDGRRILSGGDTAATQYFRDKCTEQLSTAFAPVVQNAMENVGVVRQYQQITRNPVVAPFLRNQNTDINQYVVGKTLDGLFYVLGQEEKQIRTNPAARTTAILREVFGSKLAQQH